jgi:Usg-like family
MDGGRSQSGASPMVGKRVELDDETWVFVWQDYDLAPAFPSLRKFLDY